MSEPYLMSWQGAPAYRWVKMHNRKRYRISCDDLNVPRNKESSYIAANYWWLKKLEELGPKTRKGHKPKPEPEPKVENKVEIMIEILKNNQTYSQKMIALIREIKIQKGCFICGYKEHYAALDFHHRNPKTKSFNISENKTVALNKLLEEIEKCDVVCVNCHRRIK